MKTGQGRVPRTGDSLNPTHIANCGLGAFREFRINRLELEMSFLLSFRRKTEPVTVHHTPLLENGTFSIESLEIYPLVAGWQNYR